MKKTLFIFFLLLVGNVWAASITNRCDLSSKTVGMSPSRDSVYKGTIYEIEIPCNSIDTSATQSDSSCVCTILALRTNDTVYYLNYELIYTYGPYYGSKERLDTLHTPKEATVRGGVYAGNYIHVESVLFDNQKFRCMPDIITGLIDIPQTVHRGILHEVEVPYPDYMSEEESPYTCMMLFLQTENLDFPIYYEGVNETLKERLDTLHTPVVATIWGQEGGGFVLNKISFGFQASAWYGVVRHTPMSFTNEDVSFSSFAYYLRGDTAFHDTIYQTLRNGDGVYCGAIRQSADGQQVYYRPGELGGIYPPSMGKEYLLYDFGVKEDDIIYAYDGFMDTSCEQEESVLAMWKVVSNQVIEGRKHVVVQNVSTQQEVEWIEGIGTRNILFSKTMHCLTGYDSYWTLCVADEESVLHSYDARDIGIVNECPNWWVRLPIENVEVKKTSTKIIRDGQLFIQCNGKTYNAQGVEVR